MKFFTAIVALAGLSPSTHATLRGVLPADMKELLHNKFVASGDSGDTDACNAYISAYHNCTNTDSEGTQTKGSCTDIPQDCNIICDYVRKENNDNILENGYYCVQGSGMEEDVEEEEKEEDMVATTCDICTALNTNAISCANTTQCGLFYENVNAKHCSVTCSWVLASNSDHVSENGYYCVQSLEEDVDTTN